MKQKFLLLFFGLLIGDYCIAQNKTNSNNWAFTVADRINLKPLEGVTILIAQVGSFKTNKSGNVNISKRRLKKDDNIIFSLVGYKKLIIKAGDPFPDTIKLEDSIENLTEVKINGTRHLLTIGHLDAPKKGGYLPGVNEEIAKFIPNDSNIKGTILSISYTLLNDHSGTDEPFAISLYEKNIDSPFPGKELIDDTVMKRNPINSKHVTIDISKYNLEFPGDGLLVCFKSLPRNYYPKDSVITSSGKFVKTPGIKGIFPTRRFAFADEGPVKGTYCLLRYLGNGDEAWQIFEQGIDFCIEIKVDEQ